MDVSGTSVLTTAPINKSAILKSNRDKDKAIGGDNPKSLRPHKRILKFNKKHRQKTFGSGNQFKKSYLQEQRKTLVNYGCDYDAGVENSENGGGSDAFKPARKVSKMPFKVLDAPQLQDDFYLNLVDWSSSNLLAVGLSRAVYIYSAATQQVSHLCEVN